MTKCQEPRYHEDTVKKRALNHADIRFLRDLQKELNAQDDPNPARPRFWTIMQPEDQNGTPAHYSHVDGKNTDTSTIFKGDDVNGLLADAQANDSRLTVKMHLNGGFVPSGGWTLTLNGEHPATVFSMLDTIKYLRSIAGHLEYTPLYILTTNTVSTDAMFLTRAECEEHLRQNERRYHEKARACAITAYRSNAFGKLLNLIQTLDLDNLSKLLSGSADAGSSSNSDNQQESGEQDTTIHVCVGFYPNGSYTVNYVTGEHLADNIEFNRIYRPGRAYFVDGIYTCGGHKANIPAFQARLKTLNIPESNTDSAPYQ